MQRFMILAAAAGIALAAPALADPKPSFLRGPILAQTYDGVGDDLLTAGLGKTGLQSTLAPGFADPLNPTAAELRRRAIHANYRALVDPTPGGGYGVLYGPNIDPEGRDTLGEGRIAGEEHLAFAGDGSGRENVVLMVQIPAGFDPGGPCIVTAPSSGSRGIYGAIATAGEWGLKRGCAVAYTDKGTGTGAHDLQNDKVNLITGEVESAAAAGKGSHFTAQVSPAQRAAFNAATPHRFAFKHAHSRQNPEMDWGRQVLQSVEFAFFVLNEKFGGGITPENTLVIASSVSNGGGASLRAAEMDRKGLIDGVAVSEPNVNPEPGAPFVIVQGEHPPVAGHSRSLLDYTTLVNLFQPCASVGVAAPLNLAPSANRCASLREKGLLSADTLADQAAQAQALINGGGILVEQNIVQPSHAFLFVPQSISVTYANAYGRLGVLENLCGYSFGATTVPAGDPQPLSDSALEILFAASNGIPPTGGVNLINNDSVGGPREDRVSVSPSTLRQDQNLDGALCLRSLATGLDPVTGRPLTGALRALHARVRAGIAKIRAGGDLQGLPAVIVTGRNDAILAPNHTSRAYYGLNRLVEAEASRLRYYEVLNAQHLDTLNAVPGFNDRFVPLHHYFIQAMNLLFDHLKHGTPLPPSQVVRTLPRGPGAPPITPTNVPAIDAAPAGDALITFQDGVLRIPE
jgi:hydroxybutyrate-dimer hydrolase